MDPDPINKIQQSFSKYGRITVLEVQHDTDDLFSPWHTQATAQVVFGTRVNFGASLYGVNSLTRLAEDLARIRELEYEEFVRRENPTLQKAYEEYQILLKLMK
jgi:hypothetical protein